MKKAPAAVLRTLTLSPEPLTPLRPQNLVALEAHGGLPFHKYMRSGGLRSRFWPQPERPCRRRADQGGELMQMSRHTRRAFGAAAVLGLASVLSPASVSAQQQKTIKVGITLPLTGADAEDATRIKYGAMMAIEAANAQGGAGGYKIEVITLDSGTATAGQYDPAQAATNTKKLVADPMVVANSGPQMSGEGKAMTPILSEADLATITPSSTNPDITDPKMAAQFKPKGKAIYFRTVTTDAFQGPNMANFFAQNLKVKTIFILDDSGAYGVGIADAFQRQAEKNGIKVLGRDQLNPKEADYKTILTKIKGLSPDALYYGGVMQAAAKLAPQSYEVIPKVIKAGSDGVYDLSWPKQSGKDAVEGWFCSQASPELVTSPKLEAWVTKFKKDMKREPTNYAITAYDAVYVIADSVERTAKANKPLNRSN